MVAHDLRAPLRSIRSFLQLYREDIESAEIEIPPESQESWRAIEESTAKHLSSHVEVAVSDNGIGIAESSRSRVFGMFDRAAPSGVDGIGAGLAIVQRVADRHGGSVALRSTEGLGTTVTVWLPRTATTPAADGRSRIPVARPLEDSRRREVAFASTSEVRGPPMGNDDLGEVRRRREAVLDAMASVEAALAAPVGGDTWRADLRDALVALQVTFRDHIEETEGPDGFLARVRDDAPRLSRQVDRLIGEHTELTDLSTKLIDRIDVVELERIAEEAGAVRDDAMSLLTAVARHRQRGADLIYEAYQVDVGGTG